MINQINPNISNVGLKSNSISRDGVITRKKALWFISKYACNFTTLLKERVLGEMVDLKLLEEVDRYRFKLINFHKSQPPNIDPGLWVKLMESGNIRGVSK